MTTPSIWNKIAQESNGTHIDPILGQYKARSFCNVVDLWIRDLTGKKVLKTDLREEADGNDSLLPFLDFSRFDFYGIDIAERTVMAAKNRVSEMITPLVSDVRALPFRKNSFDLVLSTSTLDHFSNENDLEVSLKELLHIIKPGGALIITLNNAHNINFRIFSAFEKFLPKKNYPINFYTYEDILKALGNIPASIQEYAYITTIISPSNSLFRICRRFLPKSWVDYMTNAVLLSTQRLTHLFCLQRFMSWFIALHITKNA